MRRLARRRDSAVESVVTASEATKNSTVTCIAKVIKQEIHSICSLEHDSILRDNIEAVKHFSWETVWLELQNKMPTLLQLLKLLVKRPKMNKPLMCLIASMVLKQNSPKLGLVQRAISVLLYGNATSKVV